MPRIFMGYDHEPTLNRETLHRAAQKINGTDGYEAVSWEDLRTGGQLVIGRVTDAIDACDLALFDLTTLNPNVLFELGYAIAKRRHIGILREAENIAFASLFRSFGLLREVGYESWHDSGSILGLVVADNFNLSDPPLGDNLLRASDELNDNSVLFMPALNRSEADTEIRGAMLQAGDQGVQIVIADPDEVRLEPLTWYASKAYSTAGAVLHFESVRRSGHHLHNARLALVGGLALGCGRQLLLQSDEDYQAPFDYQHLLKRYARAAQARADAVEWLESLDLSSSARTVRRLHLNLDVELKSLTFGEHVAENETARLPEYFLETAAYQQVLSARLCVFVGRKGTGKSANLYRAASELGDDPENLVVVVRPAAYDFAGLVDMMAALSKTSRAHTVEGVWKLLLLSEVARTIVDELRSRPTHMERTSDEAALLRGLEGAPFDLEADFGTRVSSALRSLSGLDLDELPQETRREVLNEALHTEWISRFRQMLGPVLAQSKRVAILIDNLDKGWDKSSDLAILSDLLLGLLGAVGRVERDLQKAVPAHAKPSVSLAIFLRSDIFAYVRERAREPDKIVTSTVEWQDREVLRRVLEERFLSTRSEGTEPEVLWSRFFAETVNGMPTPDYILSRILPRPRDFILFCNAAVGRAINRRHQRVEEEDVLTAEATYSQFAFESLLVENGITVADFETLLLEFLGVEPILEKSEVLEIIDRAGLRGFEAEQAFHRLKAVSFLGVEVREDEFEYPEVGRALEKAEVLARKHASAEGATRHIVHPAYRRFLEIGEPA